jgi:hypothetical protein
MLVPAAQRILRIDCALGCFQVPGHCKGIPSINSCDQIVVISNSERLQEEVVQTLLIVQSSLPFASVNLHEFAVTFSQREATTSCD